jgi:methanogenic corrinoid protein MtbC1
MARHPDRERHHVRTPEVSEGDQIVQRHALGARMVADALREDGWDVVYLGCGVPLNDLVAFADLRRPDVVALSVGMASHLAAAKVTTLALHSLAIPPRVLLGGFGCHGPEAHRVGADAVSTDLAATTPLVLELC